MRNNSKRPRELLSFYCGIIIEKWFIHKKQLQLNYILQERTEPLGRVRYGDGIETNMY